MKTVYVLGIRFSDFSTSIIGVYETEELAKIHAQDHEESCCPIAWEVDEDEDVIRGEMEIPPARPHFDWWEISPLPLISELP